MLNRITGEEEADWQIREIPPFKHASKIAESQQKKFHEINEKVKTGELPELADVVTRIREAIDGAVANGETRAVVHLAPEVKPYLSWIKWGLWRRAYENIKVTMIYEGNDLDSIELSFGWGWWRELE